MLKSKTVMVVFLALPFSSRLVAAPLRSLQSGPLGNGAVFVAGPTGAVEGRFSVTNSEGLARAESSGDRVLSDAQRNNVAVGALHPMSDSFWFHSMAAVHTWDYHAVSRGSRSFNERVSQTTFEGSAGPILRKGNVLLGGEVVLNFRGEETRKLETSTGTRRYTGKATTIPVVQGSLGLDLGNVFAVLGLKTFNQSKVDGTVKPEVGDSTSLQVAERQAGEVQFDARFRQPSGFDWGFSLTYFSTGNGSIDPEKAVVTRSAESKAPLEVEGSLGQDHLEIGFGSVYHVTAESSFLGTIKHTQESWKKPEYASLEFENSGGLEFGIGSQFASTAGNVAFGANYLLPDRRSYTQSDLKLIEVGNTGEKVNSELGTWTVQIGLTRSL